MWVRFLLPLFIYTLKVRNFKKNHKYYLNLRRRSFHRTYLYPMFFRKIINFKSIRRYTKAKVFFNYKYYFNFKKVSFVFNFLFFFTNYFYYFEELELLKLLKLQGLRRFFYNIKFFSFFNYNSFPEKNFSYQRFLFSTRGYASVPSNLTQTTKIKLNLILSISAWYLVKKKINPRITNFRDMLLNFIPKKNVLNSFTFCPIPENVKVFRNLVFLSFSNTHTNLSGITHFFFYSSIIHLIFFSNAFFFNKKNTPPLLKKQKLKAWIFKKYFLKFMKSRFKIFIHKTKQFFFKIKHLFKRRLFTVKKKLSQEFLRKSKFFYKLFRFTSLESFTLKSITLQKPMYSSPFNFLPTTKKKTNYTCTTGFFNTKLTDFQNIFCFFRKEVVLTMFFFNSFYTKFYFNKFFIFNKKVNFFYLYRLFFFFNFSFFFTNIVPHSIFKKVISKKIIATRVYSFISAHLIPWTYNNLIRFLEDCSGKKILIQFYNYITQNVTPEFLIIYRRWVPRLRYYESRLGHRFFLNEALHIIHLSLTNHDSYLFLSWLRVIIKRISFWKTRLIFRFLRYLVNNFFYTLFDSLNVKGLKLKLKGKISVAGNSRKRTILYKSGLTSHASTDVRLVHNFGIVNTFTGVLGLQVWIFY